MKKTLAIALSALLLPGLAQAATWKVTDPTTKEECSACHMAYPPALLPRASWDKILDTLPDHFGEDASLAPEKVATIRAYLDKVAPSNMRGVDNTDPVLRISDMGWFRSRHGSRLRDWAKANPKVGSISNCVACHRGAESGYFEDE